MTLTTADLDARVEGVTVPTLFRDVATRHPDRTALRWRAGDGYESWTWGEYAARATRAARALADAGVGPGDRVLLMMRNRPEFHVVDTAALLCGATPISIYNSSSPEQIAYLASHCRAKVAAADADFAERILAVRDRLPDLGPVFTAGGGGADGTVDDLVSAEPVDLDEAARRARPDDLATVIYTSGTTGNPKGVMLTHYNVAWTVESSYEMFGEESFGWRTVSYLPMAHVAERMVSHYDAMRVAMEVTTCPDPTEVATYLQQVQPQFFFGVPRVWEKLYGGIRAAAAQHDAEGFERALGVGRQMAEARLAGQEPGESLRELHQQVEAAALQPTRELVGLDGLEVAGTGAAPIPLEVIWFFLALGVPMAEVYGLSETTGPLTWAIRDDVKPGKVGHAIPGCEVRISDDGEVYGRGGNIFAGYLDEPGRTKEVLDDDGWFSTGDVGELDEDGYLRIVDRKKELIITAGGKNISPANIEAALKAVPLVGQACVVGDNRSYLVALLTLDPDAAATWAAQRGLDASVAELAQHPDVLAEVGTGIEQANAKFARPEQVKRWRLLGEEWLPDTDVLTPTMKLKRRGVHARYADEIEALYS